MMKEPKSTNKPKQTRSILSKVFGKASSPKPKKQQTPKHLPIGDHAPNLKCDENGNSKSKLARKDKSSKNTDKPKERNRKGRIKFFLFRRKKDKSDIDLPGTPPIYVELSPAKSAFVPDLISDDIHRYNMKSYSATSNSSQSDSLRKKCANKQSRGLPNSQHGLESECARNNDQTCNLRSDEDCYDMIPMQSRRINNTDNNPPVALDSDRRNVKRASSFSSKQIHGSVSNAAEDDVPPSVYAGMCRKSNLMLQTVQESGSKRRLDRSFLRWNSVADLQYQTSKDKRRAASKMSKVTQNDKSISLQDLSTKPNNNAESGKRPIVTTNTSATSRDQTAPESDSIKISKIRPSFDKALSKSEYDLRDFHSSPTSRGILAFKKVNLPNVRRTGARPVSAILPSTLSIIGEKPLSAEGSYPMGPTKLAIPTHNTAIVKPTYHSTPDESEYVDVSSVRPSLLCYALMSESGRDNRSGNVSLGRTHSFQDRYSPPLYRRAHRNDVARPVSCIEQDTTGYPPLWKEYERSPCQNNTRRGGTVSRSRSRARSIAKRYNISTSTENISPSQLRVCTSNNWKSTDTDPTVDYCSMKSLIRNSSVMPCDGSARSVGYTDTPFTYSNATERNHVPDRCGNVNAPYYSDKNYLDGSYGEPFHQNVRRRKLFYALDV